MKYTILVLLSMLTACGGGGHDTAEPVVLPDLTQYRRNIDVSNRTEVECPRQATAIFIAGQSNAANSSINPNEETSTSVLQYFGNKCYIAQSPTLGANGPVNNPFHQVMIDYQKRIGGIVIYGVFAVGGQPIHKFDVGGEFHLTFKSEYNSLDQRYPIQYFLWQQGETDAANLMSKEQYLTHWGSMISSIDIKRPMLARSTRCADMNPYDNQVGSAQDQLRAILGGPDTDLDIPSEDRHDQCHFDTSGVLKLSTLWNLYLK